MFRLSRVRGSVSRKSKGDAYAVPPGTDLRELTTRLGPGPRTVQATVLIRPGAAAYLRRTGAAQESGVTGPDGTPGWDRFVITSSSIHGLADEVLAHSDRVCVEAPAELVDLVVARLDAAALSAAGGAA
jgi:proteasome accessory factor B